MKVEPGDPYHLSRFFEAQAPVYSQVVEELRQGCKTGHWMWFIFPQVAGLGSSAMARRFAISSLAEAEAYLNHPVLGRRLEECAAILLKVSGKTAYEILGSPDDLKFRSCMTLFARAGAKNSVFEDNLTRYFGGKSDPLTIELLRRSGYS
jgi:uncharacterized protein (DUF1810 family)